MRRQALPIARITTRWCHLLIGNYLLATVGLCVSSSDIRRQIQIGGVRLDGKKLADPNREFAAAAELEDKLLQLGSKTFRLLVG